MKTSADLEQMLRDIDRKSYPAYKTLKGNYRFHTYILSIDHVQGDPFASPSRLTIRIDGKAAGFSEELWMTPDRKQPLKQSQALPKPFHPVRKRTSRLSAFPVHGKQEKTGTAPTSAR